MKVKSDIPLQEISDSIDGLAAGLVSPNEADRNGEPANVVDGLYAIARAIERLASVLQSR